MKARHRLICHGNRGGAYYCVDTKTGERTSLRTTDEKAAQKVVFAKNEADRQAALNLHLAKAYLAGTDGAMTTRTWGDALTTLTNTKKGSTKERWERAAKDPAYAQLLPKVIIETTADALLRVMAAGKVSTNIHLRRLHNFVIDMGYLP